MSNHSEIENVAVRLERPLVLRDLVLFNLVAVIGISWLATAAKAGASAVTLWLLAALLFFIPQGLAVVELSSSYPEEGGIYAWTKREFGEGHGFLCGWCYWISNVFFYPSLLLSTAVSATFAIGRGDTDLASNWHFVLTFTLVALWVAACLNIVGVGTGKWLQNAGGISVYAAGAILLALGLYAALTSPPANSFALSQLKPDLTHLPSLNLWATIAFAFAGLELSSTMGSEIQNARRNLPRSILVAAPLIAVVYICGTASLLWLVPREEMSIVGGAFQAISVGVGRLTGALWWVAPVAAALATLGRLGSLGAWLSGPARIAFVVGLDRYFPAAFGRIHTRWRTPYVAILVQAVLATIFMLLSVLGRGTTVETAFLILLDTSLLLYFIPYVYLFACFIAHTRARRNNPTSAPQLTTPGGRSVALVAGLAGLLLTLFAMCVAMIPPPDTSDPLIFELKVVGGSGLFVLLGGAIYLRAKRKTRRADRARMGN